MLEQSTINMRLYRFCARLFKVVGSIRYGFKVDKTAIKGMKGPFLVLGNHTSWVDFLYFSNCVYPHPTEVTLHDRSGGRNAPGKLRLKWNPF